MALKKFSENYWYVYGENFRWKKPELFPDTSPDSPAVEYIGKEEFVSMFDPLFGNNWGDSCSTLEEAKELFNTKSKDKEILFIRGHPSSLNDNTSKTMENLSLWEEWIDWIYQEHDLININHTQVIHYNVDREKFKVRKNNVNKFTIDLTDCQFDHTVLFSDPYGQSDTTWNITDESGIQLDNIEGEGFVELLSGSPSDKRQDKILSKLSKLEKLQLIVKEHFPLQQFTTQAALTAYEDALNEPIALSTVSTYLTRLSDRGFLVRSGTRYRRQYRMSRPAMVLKQEIGSHVLPEF